MREYPRLFSQVTFGPSRARHLASTSSAMTTPSELRALRLQSDERALSDVERELADVHARIASFEQQRGDLEQAARVADDWRVQLESRHEELCNSVNAQRRLASPFAHFPDDILREIFMQQALEPDELWRTLGEGYFNKRRARAPFAVSGVSRSWRTVALSAPRIWDYAGVPSLDANNQANQASRIRVVIARSTASPLDIVFNTVLHSLEEAYTEILELLYPHAHRWRRFEWRSVTPCQFLLPFFRAPVPSLEEFYISCRRERPPWPQHTAPYLSRASKLRSIVIWYASISPAGVQPRPLLAHVDFRALGAPPTHCVWGSFASANTLKTLSLGWDHGFAVMDAPQSIVLPCLRRFDLYDGAVTLLVQHPTLLKPAQLADLGIYVNWEEAQAPRPVDLLPFLNHLHDFTPTSLKMVTLAPRVARAPEAALLGQLQQRVATVKLTNCYVDDTFWSLSLFDGIQTLALDDVGFRGKAAEKLLSTFAEHMQAHPESTVRVLTEEGELSERDRTELLFLQNG